MNAVRVPVQVWHHDAYVDRWVIEARPIDSSSRSWAVSLFEPGSTRSECQAEVHDCPLENGPFELARQALNAIRAEQRHREFRDAERDRVDWVVGT